MFRVEHMIAEQKKPQEHSSQMTLKFNECPKAEAKGHHLSSLAKIQSSLYSSMASTAAEAKDTTPITTNELRILKDELSHHVRTPLHGILNLTNFVQEAYQNFINAIKENKNILEKLEEINEKLILVKECVKQLTAICEEEKLKLFTNEANNLVSNMSSNIHEMNNIYQKLKAVIADCDKLNKQDFQLQLDKLELDNQACINKIQKALEALTLVVDQLIGPQQVTKISCTTFSTLKVGTKIPDAKAVALIVDDNAVNQKILARILKNCGYECVIADNGLDAVQKFSPGKFHIVLMDLSMPIMDGYIATQKIRQLEKDNNSTPVTIIAVTANSSDQHKDTALTAGMNGFIAKPFSKEDICSQLPKEMKNDLPSPVIPAQSMEKNLVCIRC